jgi:hypothetical protein
MKIQTAPIPKFTPNFVNLSTKSIEFDEKHSDFKIRTQPNLTNLLTLICPHQTRSQKQTVQSHKKLPSSSRFPQQEAAKSTGSIDHPFNTKERKKNESRNSAGQSDRAHPSFPSSSLEASAHEHGAPTDAALRPSPIRADAAAGGPGTRARARGRWRGGAGAGAAAGGSGRDGLSVVPGSRHDAGLRRAPARVHHRRLAPRRGGHHAHASLLHHRGPLQAGQRILLPTPFLFSLFCP